MRHDLKIAMRRFLLTFLVLFFVVCFRSGSAHAASGAVAKVGSTRYSSFAKALKQAPSGATIKLLKNTTLNSSNPYMTITGKELTIDLNGKKLTNKVQLYFQKCSVTIKNGTYCASNPKSASGLILGAIHGEQKTTIRVSGCTLSENKMNYSLFEIKDSGSKITFQNCSASLKNCLLLTNGYKSTAVFKSGSYEGESVLICNSGTLQFDGGRYNCLADTDTKPSLLIYNQKSTAYINGKTKTSYGKVIVNKGSFYSAFAAIENTENCTCIINGGTITGRKLRKVNRTDLTKYGDQSLINNYGRLTVNGGTIQEKTAGSKHRFYGMFAIEAFKGKVSINGGKVTNNRYSAILKHSGARVTVSSKATVQSQKDYKNIAVYDFSFDTTLRNSRK